MSRDVNEKMLFRNNKLKLYVNKEPYYSAVNSFCFMSI